MSNENDFANRVRSYREENKLSQEEFAKMLGVTRNYVSMLEGGRAPSEQLLNHFALIEREGSVNREDGENADSAILSEFLISSTLSDDEFSQELGINVKDLGMMLRGQMAINKKLLNKV